jgi:hypothetical protein
LISIAPHSGFSSALKTILFTWLIAGTFDLSMAIIVWAVVLRKVSATNIILGISSAAFGQDAFVGGSKMIFLGILFHYFIVLSFTLLYFFTFPYIGLMQKQKVISGILYGIFAWAFMKYIVLPLSLIQQSPFKWSSALISTAILMLCIGLPISIIVHRYYSEKKLA